MRRSVWLTIVAALAVILMGLLIFAAVAVTKKNAPSTEPTTLPATTAQPTTVPVTTAPPATVPTTAPSTEPTTELPYEDTVPATLPETVPPAISPDIVGIYIPAGDGSAARTLIREFSAPRTAKKDIDCFEVLSTNASRVDGSSFSEIWVNAWLGFDERDNAKIGFHIRFTLADGTEVDQTILKPGDAKGFYDYLEVYIYDDINNAGQWYSHLEDNQIDDSTIMSSIKLTSGSKIDLVGDIYLTAFIYNGDHCFDADGNYTGNVSATILIKE